MKTSLIYTLTCVIAVMLTAYFVHPFWLTLYTCGILVLFELALSFDNAIVNAKVLQHMNPFWQKMFLTWGIVIAVVIVRFLFPIVLVYIASPYNFGHVWQIVLHNPTQYSTLLHKSYPMIAGFGAGFLGMLFLQFLKETRATQNHWCRSFERLIVWHGWPGRLIVFIFVGAFVAYATMLPTLFVVYLIAGLLQWGVNMLRQRATHNVLHTAGKVLQVGLIGFIYLELIDASFSLDSVLGAFAISENIIVIMIGLGCGALVIRALTVHMVRVGLLQKWRYLEHGAHYAIGALAIILLLKVMMPVPEWIAGGVSIVLIAAALLHSWLKPADQHD